MGGKARAKAIAGEPRLLSYDEVVALLKERGLYDRIRKGAWPSDLRSGALLYSGSLAMERLRLDHDQPIDDEVGRAVPDAVIVDGDLEVSGVLKNGEMDFGPCLVVLGDMRVHVAVVAGAPIWVMGDLTVTDTFHGYYNHGYLEVFGEVEAELFVADDYFAKLHGRNRGNFVDEGHVEGNLPRCPGAGELIDSAFLEVEEEEEERYLHLDSNAIYNALVKGRSIRKR